VTLPSLNSAVAYHRFHRSVRQQRDVIISLENPAAVRKRLTPHRLDCVQFFPHYVRSPAAPSYTAQIVGRIWPVVPLDLQPFASLKGSPGVIGDDSDAPKG